MSAVVIWRAAFQQMDREQRGTKAKAKSTVLVLVLSAL